jgi:hypothetical protein
LERELGAKAMKSRSAVSNSSPAPAPLKRRGLLVGAGIAGAAALAAKALPGAAPVAPAVAVAPKVIDTDGGYRESAHVLRYYETTRA